MCCFIDVCVSSDENMTLTIDAVATTVGNMNHNGKTQTMMSLNQLTDAERDEVCLLIVNCCFSRINHVLYRVNNVILLQVWRRHTIGIDEPGPHDTESKSSERSDKPRKKQSKKSSRDKRKVCFGLFFLIFNFFIFIFVFLLKIEIGVSS